MIKDILNVILPHLIVFAGLYAVVFLAIIADFVAGWRKAKKDGFIWSSKGLRQTVKKIVQYYNMLFVVSLIDVVQMVGIWQGGFDIVKMPLFSFIATIFLCIIELKSIYERNSDKERANMEIVAKFLAKAAKDKDVKELIATISDKMDEK